MCALLPDKSTPFYLGLLNCRIRCIKLFYLKCANEISLTLLVTYTHYKCIRIHFEIIGQQVYRVAIAVTLFFFLLPLFSREEPLRISFFLDGIVSVTRCLWKGLMMLLEILFHHVKNKTNTFSCIC